MAAQGKAFVDEGGAIIEILGEGATTQPGVTAWADSGAGLQITTVTDAEGHAGASLRTLGIRETVVVINLSTMVVEFLRNGNVLGIGPSSISEALADGRARLAAP